ncbi:LGFP repeat-containing protein [Gordonia sp. SL306]|uniref:LGFP repeat-containing protein n=1 Tax=Gordonia sp. SL306 TaxID=2995145 RepID=UPI0022717A6A|nr:hypothetical protein [Gordonia sp. SL306]WAC54418.1 hypothetical protein OVA31_17295 [Gordonia sp. SL306]
MATSHTRARLGGLALGFIAAAGTALLLAPHAGADPQSDAQAAIAELEQQISAGDADRGQADTGLGAEDGDLTAVGGGFEQEFANGTVFWSPEHGARVLYGGILAKYTDEGGPTGSLGFPAQSEGPADYRPTGRGASFAAADQPKIYWTPSGGAWVVRGPFTVATDKLGATLGAPTADMTTSGDVVSQEFANGTLTYSRSTGAWTSAPDPNWAQQLSGSSIPGMADSRGDAAAADDTNTSDSDTDGSSWWWLLIPFLLILAGLFLIWLFRKARGPKTPDVRADEVPVATAPDAAVDRSDAEGDAGTPSTHRGAAAGVAAAAGGAVAAGAAIGARREGETPEAGETDVPTPDSGERAVVDDAADEAGADVASEAASAEPHPDVAEMPAADIGDEETVAAVADGTVHGHGDGVGYYVANGRREPVPVGAHLPLDDPKQAPDGYPIKVSAADGVYYTPTQPSYAEIEPEVWFASESAAESASFSKSVPD